MLPPPSAVITSELASGYLDAPISFHQVWMVCTVSAARNPHRTVPPPRVTVPGMSKYTDERRAELVALVAAGTATIAEAAAQLGVGESTAYGWVSKADPPRLAAPEKSAVPTAKSAKSPAPVPTFVRLARESSSDATVEVQLDEVTIRVRRGFDAHLLRDVIAAVREGVS